MLGMRMDIRQGKVAESETNTVSQSIQDRFYDGLNLATKRALLVSELEQCDRCIYVAYNVISCFIR